jgi:hypothetical protein
MDDPETIAAPRSQGVVVNARQAFNKAYRGAVLALISKIGPFRSPCAGVQANGKSSRNKSRRCGRAINSISPPSWRAKLSKRKEPTLIENAGRPTVIG